MSAFRLAAHRRICNPNRGRATPRRHPIVGAPFWPGERVLVVAAVDPHVFDVSRFLGESGVVDYLEYDCGAGQSFPTDPMIGVVFSDGRAEEFWREELAAAAFCGERGAGEAAARAALEAWESREERAAWAKSTFTVRRVRLSFAARSGPMQGG